MFYISAGLSQLPRLHSLLVLLALCYAVKVSSFLIHTFLKLFQNGRVSIIFYFQFVQFQGGNVAADVLLVEELEEDLRLL